MTQTTENTAPKRYLRPSDRAMESVNAAFRVGCDLVLKDWIDQGGPEKEGLEFRRVCAGLLEKVYADGAEMPKEQIVYAPAFATLLCPGGSPRVGPRERQLWEIHGDGFRRGIDLAVFDKLPGSY